MQDLIDTTAKENYCIGMKDEGNELMKLMVVVLILDPQEIKFLITNLKCRPLYVNKSAGEAN